MAKQHWGFNVNSIDTGVRPQDDFYSYANGGWLKANTIPLDESRWGTFTMLRVKTEHQLKEILSDILKNLPAGKVGKAYTKGSPEQLIGDFYRSAADMKKRNALGSRPLAPWLKEIHAIKTQKDLQRVIGLFHSVGIVVPWDFCIDQDSKNSGRYLLHLMQDGIGLPEREYYLSDAPEQKRVREAYIQHIERILTLSGMKKPDVVNAVSVVMKIETMLARASMKKEDTRDAEKVYHKRTVSQLKKEVPEIAWEPYFMRMGAGRIHEVIVAQPEFLKVVGKMLTTIPLSEWQVYLEWHITNSCSSLLSDAFGRAAFDFYGKVLTGSGKRRAPWRRALGSVNGNLGEALGKLYVQHHFPQGAKRRMELLVADLFAAYEKRIKALDWMLPSTKKKALQKLRAMNKKIGYPTKFENYRGVTIRPDDFFGNTFRAQAYEHKKAMRRLHKPVDKKEWLMTPQTVNAYCHFNLNEIVFPAAILQAPFFDKDADDAVNYGAIGAVIGHEITHGFDDQGCKFDGRGNMSPWWSKKDAERFGTKAKVVVKQFNEYVAAPGVHVNGQLTLGENIADLGGASIAFDAYLERLKKTDREDIDGFTPEQRFFLGFAQAERELARPEFTKMQALTDPHSVAYTRVNGPLSNLESFYKAFDVKKGDTLYREPNKRAKIW
ncbi:MAG: M13 family metallopeptidase [bacterium]